MPMKITPILGLYHNHASENVIIQSGMQTRSAISRLSAINVP